jgi:ribosome-associated protein
MTDAALSVNARLKIPRSELLVRATRSSGPGGQHVNTSSTRIELVWNIDRSSSLTQDDRARLRYRLSTRIDADGDLRIVSSDSRSQRQNREAAEQRLVEMVRRALVVPKKRRPTKPTKGSIESRLNEKRRRSSQKQNRQRRVDDE